MRKLIVVGQGRHGKDTFCEIAEQYFGLTFESSSSFACRSIIFEILKDKYGYKSIEDCFEDRHNHRTEWYDLICEYNSKDKTRLAQEILNEHDIYCGMRSIDELEAVMIKGYADLVVWVDASQRLGVTEDVGSNTITKSDADIIIDNNDSLLQFTTRVLNLLNVIYTKENG